MSKTWLSIVALSTVGGMTGCANVTPPAAGATAKAAPPGAQIPVQVAPAPAARAGLSRVESAYLMGRAAHGDGRLGEAQQFYEEVLSQAPRHVGALNGLAVIHAQNGDLDRAMALFQQAIALAPQAAHLHNNAGYALLRAGRLEEARQELERAQSLDPANPNTRRNLAEVREQLASQAQAEGTQPRKAPPPGVNTSAADNAAGPQVVAVAPNVYELRYPAAEPTAAKSRGMSVATAPAAARLAVRMEIANGAGITHLARRTAERLAPMGWVSARLTNLRPYRQQTTEIQYGAGYAGTAAALQGQLPVATRAVEARSLGRGVQMRLVLGHDLGAKAVAAWLDDRTESRTAARTPDDGWRWS